MSEDEMSAKFVDVNIDVKAQYDFSKHISEDGCWYACKSQEIAGFVFIYLFIFFLRFCTDTCYIYLYILDTVKSRLFYARKLRL